MDFREVGWEVVDWIGTSGGPLWTHWWTFRFHRRQGVSWL